VQEILVRYLHFLGIIILSSSLVAEHLLLSVDTSLNKFRRLAIIDSIYGASALLIFFAGGLLAFVVGKPSAFYTHNWIFKLKVSLFLTIGLLSIYPTIFFIRNRRKLIHEVIVPRGVVMCIRLELVILVCIPLLAALMAKGIGLVQ
jgi:putative membrane protein